MPLHRSLAFVVVLLIAAALCGPGAVAAQSEMVIVKEASGQGDKHYHRPGCPVVRDGKDVLAMTRAEAESRGFKAHRDCEAASSAQPPQGPGTASTKPPSPPPETVFVDSGTTYYHRKNCARLGKDAKGIALTAVGKRWPCPACRPPVPKRTTEPVVPRWRGPGRGGRAALTDTPATLAAAVRS